MDESKTLEPQQTFGWALPPAQGLYDPSIEKDACGVGFMVQTKGIPSHSIVMYGNNVLCKLSSRGAVGADPRDGDGAGLMIAIPHKFFDRLLSKEGVTLPPAGHYAAGNIFFSQDEVVRKSCMETFEREVTSLNLKIAHWRMVSLLFSSVTTRKIRGKFHSKFRRNF